MFAEIVAKLENDHHLRQRPGSWWVFAHRDSPSPLQGELFLSLRCADGFVEEKCLADALSKKQHRDRSGSSPRQMIQHSSLRGRKVPLACWYYYAPKSPRQQQLRRQTLFVMTSSSHPNLVLQEERRPFLQ